MPAVSSAEIKKDAIAHLAARIAREEQEKKLASLWGRQRKRAAAAAADTNTLVLQMVKRQEEEERRIAARQQRSSSSKTLPLSASMPAVQPGVAAGGTPRARSRSPDGRREEDEGSARGLASTAP